MTRKSVYRFLFPPLVTALENNKFSDDGSAAIVDLSGVIIWSTADGTTRRLPDTETAAPLYVTNSEVLVWDNRFASEFLSYAQKPTVSLTLYRTNTEGEIFTTSVELAGKDVLGTPQITTSTGSLTIATTEALDGGQCHFYQQVTTHLRPRTPIDVLVKFYRVTFSGIAQLLETYH